MANGGTVNVNLVARTAAFTSDMKRAANSITSLETVVGRAQALVVGFLGVQALRSVVAWTGGIMESMDATAKFADRIGTTTEFLSAMSHAAELSGVSNETLNNGLQKMVKNVSEAATGNKALADSFAELRLNATALAALSPEEQFTQLSEAVRGVANAGDRTRLVMDVFGKTGAELVPILDLGASGMREMREEADALGLTFSRMEAAKIEQANDALTRVGSLMTGIGRDIAIEVSPIVTALANDFVASAKSMGGFGEIAGSVMRAIVTGIGILGDAWNVLLMGVHALKAAFYASAAAWSEAGNAIVHGVQFLIGLWNNWVQLVQDSTGLLVETFGYLWARAKQPIAEFVQFTGKQLAALLHQAADASSRLKGSLSSDLRAAAFSIGVSTGDATARAKASADAAAGAMSTAAGNVKASWSNLFNVETTGSDQMRGLAAGFQKSGEESAWSFKTAYNAVLNQDASNGTADMFARIKASADAMAEVTAAQIKARQEGLAVGAAAEVETVVAHETWLTAFLGNEAEKRAKFDKKTMADKLDFTAGILGNLASLQNTHSKKAFAVGKAAAMAQAIISTAAGITRAFQDLPIWAAIPAAAGIAAAGAVQISTIASTSFGGGGSISSAGGSIPLVNGEPVGVGQSAQPGVTGNRQNALNINFTGLSDNQVLNGQQVRMLIDQINEAQADGSTVVNVRAA